MTVRISKPALNVREELSKLNKPSGVAGEAMLRAETPQEQFNLIGAGRKNFLINGEARISQRGDFTSPTTGANQYFVDRWAANHGVGCTLQQLTDVSIPEEPLLTRGIRIVATTTGNTYMGARQKIEDPNKYAGATMTYSAWVRSNNPNARLTMYMVGSSQIVYSDPHSGNGQWERLVVTFTVKPSVSTWYVDVFIASEAIGGVPIGSGDYLEATGMQLEMGRVATPFENRSEGEELALCQRYYYKSDENHVCGQAYSASASDGFNTTHTFPVTMRANPSVTLSGGNDGGSAASLAVTYSRRHGVTIRLTSTDASTQVWWAGFIVTASAEV